MNNPVSSIIMPAYNSEKYIHQAIESVLNQTFKDFELVIADDVSTDNTLKIINYYAKQDKRIRVIRNMENLGCYQNMNKIIKFTRGKYISPLANDDILAPEYLEKTVNFFSNNPNIHIAGYYFAVFTNEHKFNQTKIFPQEYDIMKFIRLPFGRMGTGAYSVRREVYDRFQYDIDQGSAGDYSFLIKIFTYSSYKVSTIPEFLYYWRRHDLNYSTKHAHYMHSYPNILALNYLSKVYRVFVDPIIEQTLYAIREQRKINSKEFKLTKEAIYSLSNTLKEKYANKLNFQPHELLENQFRFLTQ